MPWKLCQHKLVPQENSRCYTLIINDASPWSWSKIQISRPRAFKWNKENHFGAVARGVAVGHRLRLTSIFDMQQYMLSVVSLFIHLHYLWSHQCLTWKHWDVQIFITIQVKDVEDIFYDVRHLSSISNVLYYRSELTNVNTALDKDTYQCTICKEKLYLKDPAQIRQHPKLKVIICRVSTRHTCSKHALFL